MKRELIYLREYFSAVLSPVVSLMLWATLILAILHLASAPLCITILCTIIAVESTHLSIKYWRKYKNV
jgi:hypothetical protein